jgi:hypothetical protein
MGKRLSFAFAEGTLVRDGLFAVSSSSGGSLIERFGRRVGIICKINYPQELGLYQVLLLSNKW